MTVKELMELLQAAIDINTDVSEYDVVVATECCSGYNIFINVNDEDEALRIEGQ